MEENQLNAVLLLNGIHSRVSFATGHDGLLSGVPLDAPERIQTGCTEAHVDSFGRTVIVSKAVSRARWSDMFTGVTALKAQNALRQAEKA